MPVATTLGALVTFKAISSKTNNYWIISMASNNNNTAPLAYGINQFNSSNQSNIIVNGETPAAGGNGFPTVTFITANYGNLPTLTKNYWFNSNSNNTTRDVIEGYRQNYVILNSNLIIPQNQRFVIGGNSTICEVIRTFDISNNYNFTSTYVNPPNVTISTGLYRRVNEGIFVNQNNNTFTTIGSITNDSGTKKYITTYYSNNVIQSEKNANFSYYPSVLDGVGNICNVNANSFLMSDINTIVQYNTFNSSIEKQRKLNLSNTEIVNLKIDNLNNIYCHVSPFNTGGSNLDCISKIDENLNTIIWQKSPGGNVRQRIINIDYYNNNVYFITADLAFGNVPNKLVSLDANTGNINWVRQISVTGTNRFANIGNYQAAPVPTGFAVNETGLYINYNILGRDGAPSYNYNGNYTNIIIKLRNDGAILGNGVYNINTNVAGNIIFTYANSNITLSNANLVLSNSNIVISNASIANTISNNVTANTVVQFQYNSVAV